MNYLKEYSTDNKYCQFYNCSKLGVWRRQNTQYTDDKLNWGCFCCEHQKETDKYWEEMWGEYYNNVL